MTTDEGRKLVEQMKRDTKMGHEALLELVMGQFAVMTAEERARLLEDVGEWYCWFCGKDRQGARRTLGVCACRW
jgi:hypothetical protein